MSLPETVRLIADVPRVQARLRPQAVAMVHEGRKTTFLEMDRRSTAVARGLIAAGVRPGDRVAFLARDSDRLYECLFGCAKAGAVIMGINWRLKEREVRFILEDGEAAALFVSAESLPLVEGIVDELPGLRSVVLLDGESRSHPVLERWREAHAGDDPRLPGDPEAVAVQMYTSGTTGNPKGVQLPNRSFFDVILSMRRHGDPWIGMSPADVSLCAFPSFHIGGLWWAMTSMNAGACSIIVRSFTPAEALDLIQERGVTKICMVPAMIQMLLDEPGCEATDFSSLDHLVYGGSPIPVPLLERAMEVFGCEFAQIYGLTETGNTAVCLRPEDHRCGRPELLRAAGRPYPGVRVKCIDREGRELPPGEVGEICILSPANMVGYWKRPDATRETLVDGWVHTGDAGFIDEDGYVFVSDRIKDMIISAGENIYPAEIESVLAAHPGVAEVAVIGVPDERWGELVKAVVVPRPGAEPRVAEILAHARAHLADFKVPRTVDFVEALPRTPSGKVKKGVLR